jgi:hypothetical protein
MLSLPALAQQPGSTGGTIGRTGKSVSGGEEPAPKNQQRATSSSRSLAGAWNWAADCTSGHYHGVFELSPSGGREFSGRFTGTNISDLGPITNGRLDGAKISFLRHAPPGDIIQHWIGQLAADHIVGSISGNENCRWQANK